MCKQFSSTRWLVALACVWGYLSPAATAGTFTVNTRDDVLILTSQIQATQFLTHATFGATEDEINSLATRMRQIGTIAAADEWITNQIALPIDDSSRHLPLAESMMDADTAFFTSATSGGTPITIGPTNIGTVIPNRTNYRQMAWFHRSITNADQLRQKTAWALSQIIAVGNNFNNFNEEEIEGSGPAGTIPKSRFLGLSNYYDKFINRALAAPSGTYGNRGSYRDLLQDVTYHAIMGDWLSSRGNAKEDLALNRFPDENYAREVMQLFTIGLYMLTDEGVQQLDGTGAPIPTYDNDDIREYAQVFTGMGYFSSSGSSFSGTVRFQHPMTMAQGQHDTSSKVLLNGVTLPALPASPTQNQANGDITSALNGLIDHPSCPPFISRLLIQRFVKSNPSRAYLNRVVNVFKNNGSGIRGDIRAVVRAILLDPEAWQPIRTQYLRNPNRIVVTTLGSEDSRIQEPLMNWTRFMRFFKGVARYESSQTDFVTDTNGNITGITTTYPNVVSGEFRLQSRNTEFSQTPYGTPSVFNFYLPDYQSSELVGVTPSSRIPNGALSNPEAQIVDALTSNRTANLYLGVIDPNAGNIGVASVHTAQHFAAPTFSAGPPATIVPRTSTNTAGSVSTYSTGTRCRVNFDQGATYNSFTRQCEIAATIPLAAGGSRPLVEHLDLYVCGGTLNEGYRTKLISVLDGIRATQGPTVSTTEAMQLARAAILCVVTSPSFLVTE